MTVTEWVPAGMVTVAAGSLTVPAEAAAMLPAKAGRSKITGPPRGGGTPDHAPLWPGTADDQAIERNL